MFHIAPFIIIFFWSTFYYHFEKTIYKVNTTHLFYHKFCWKDENKNVITNTHVSSYFLPLFFDPNK